MKRQINSANWPCSKDQQEEQTSEQVENGLMVLFLCNTNKDNSICGTLKLLQVCLACQLGTSHVGEIFGEMSSETLLEKQSVKLLLLGLPTGRQ